MSTMFAFARPGPPAGSSAARPAGSSAADDAGSSTARRRTAAGVMTAIVLLALNLRTLVASLPPLLTHVRSDLGLSGFAAGLLTTLPVLAFGAFAPLAPRLTRRVSIERVLVGCAALTAVAAGLRGAGGWAPLFAGCALAGLAVALAQAVLPVFIRLRHPDITGLLTGAYSMSLTLGATLAAALAVPLEDRLGSWEASLAAWALPAGLAALVWLPAALRPGTTVTGARSPGLWGNRLAWNVSLFMGVQSMAFYAGLTWLPSVFKDAGFSEGEAGSLQALGALVQLVPAFVVPVIAARSRSQVGVLLAIVAFSTAGVVGLILAPSAALLWILVFGFGQGGALGLGLILPVLRGADAASVASLTAMSLCVGYIVAAAGPWLLGAANDLTGGWTVALIVLAAICVLELAPGLPASRARRLERGA
jgi:CP family cyanate transporter-like MFS transporter